MRNRNTVEFLWLWEKENNPFFKPLEFEGFKKQAGLNSFVLTPKRWIETTNALGIISKSSGKKSYKWDSAFTNCSTESLLVFSDKP